MKELYIKSKINLYIAIASAFSDGVSTTLLGLNIAKGNLENSLFWGSITLLNTASVIGNYIFSKK